MGYVRDMGQFVQLLVPVLVVVANLLIVQHMEYMLFLHQLLHSDAENVVQEICSVVPCLIRSIKLTFSFCRPKRL